MDVEGASNPETYGYVQCFYFDGFTTDGTDSAGDDYWNESQWGQLCCLVLES